LFDDDDEHLSELDTDPEEKSCDNLLRNYFTTGNNAQPAKKIIAMAAEATHRPQSPTLRQLKAIAAQVNTATSSKFEKQKKLNNMPVVVK
jgi:hypothetical protein